MMNKKIQADGRKHNISSHIRYSHFPPYLRAFSTSVFPQNTSREDCPCGDISIGHSGVTIDKVYIQSTLRADQELFSTKAALVTEMISLLTGF
jgi:hypothetical protein